MLQTASEKEKKGVSVNFSLDRPGYQAIGICVLWKGNMCLISSIMTS